MLCYLLSGRFCGSMKNNDDTEETRVVVNYSNRAWVFYEESMRVLFAFCRLEMLQEILWMLLLK